MVDCRHSVMAHGRRVAFDPRFRHAHGWSIVMLTTAIRLGRSKGRMMALYLVVPFLITALFAPPTFAQEAPPALDVRLRDVAGRGVPDVLVTVTDRSGTQLLDRRHTDGDGRAHVGPLPVAEVRVQVAGALPDGTALTLVGADRAGIPVILGAPPLTLELRTAPDGTVLPDPAALAREDGADTVVVSPLPTARVVPATPAPVIQAVPPPAAMDTGAVSTEPAAAAPLALGFLLLSVVVLILAAVLVAQARWRRS
jgi:hypothetical protein